MEILGVDIGGSGVKGALVNTKTGELISERFRLETPQPATPKAIAETLKNLVSHFHWQGAIGCGFPAIIKNGVSLSASNIDKKFIGTNVAEIFTQTTGCETSVLNDADAAGLAELKFGAGCDLKGVVLIVTVGTGLGTAVFVNGILLPNTELGHIILPNQKVAEHFASGAVREKNELSWKKWGQRFNEYLTQLEFLISPDLIVIGGGVSKRFEKFSKTLTCGTKVVPAKLFNHAGIIGAALNVALKKK